MKKIEKMKTERIWTAKCKECFKPYKRNTRHSKLCDECRDKINKRKKYNLEQMTEKQLLREIRKLINASDLKEKEQLIKLIKEYKTRE